MAAAVMTSPAAPGLSTETVSVGDVSGAQGRVVRIVCLSDTHQRHAQFERRGIPLGDILVHCGDFFTRLRDNRYHWALGELDAFMERQPHRHKIFVPGNHEIAFRHHCASTIQQHVPHCHVLRDSGVEVEGIRFYGTPWTTSGKVIPRGLGFSTSELTVQGHWAGIPDDIDILLTHQPPFNILDLAVDRKTGPGQRICSVCSQVHNGLYHWGSYALREEIVKRVRPKVHVFGHVHDSAGTVMHDDILFVNAAMEMREKPVVIDYHCHSGATPENSSSNGIAVPTSGDSEVKPVQVIPKKCDAHQCSIS